MKDIRIPTRVYSSLYPIIVELPDNPRDLEISVQEYYKDLIRKFIGYEIYLG